VWVLQCVCLEHDASTGWGGEDGEGTWQMAFDTGVLLGGLWGQVCW
jgi:hypothetical protein